MRYFVLALFIATLLPAAGLAQDVRPSQRFGQAAAFDAARGRLVVFGGISADAQEALDDTWEWDGTRWHAVAVATAPPARVNAAMVYDPGRRRIVMFGGFTREGPLGDTWEYDGATWIAPALDHGPGPRMLHSLAYDPGNQRVLLVGGMVGEIPHDDIWEWDGSVWVQRDSGTAFDGPSPFETTRMRAYRAALRSDLRNLMTVQEMHFADNVTYAASLDQLGDMYVSTTGVTVTIVSGSGTGWAAVAVHERAPDAKCGLWVGDAAPPFPEAVDEGVPICVGFP